MTRSLNRHLPPTRRNESSYRAVAMISMSRPGTCCSVVLYDRAVARPASSSTSMIVFVTRCLVRGVPSAYRMIPSPKVADTERPSHTRSRRARAHRHPDRRVREQLVEHVETPWSTASEYRWIRLRIWSHALSAT